MKKTVHNDKLEERDHAKYFLHIPDADFNPVRNQEIVENSIKKYEAMRRKKKHEYDEAYAERSDAVASYLKSFDYVGDHSLLG